MSEQVRRLVAGVCATGLAAAGLVGLAGLTGCEGGEGARAEGDGGDRPRIAYITNGVDPFWSIAEAGVHAAAEELDVRAEVHMPTEGTPHQQRFVEDLVTRGVDGIAISPIDPANQRDLINRAAQHTRVITHDSDAPDTERLLYIGMDNYEAGRMCGELVKEALPDGGQVMILVGRLEQDNAARRRQGVIDELLGRSHDPSRYDPPGQVLEGDGFTVLGTMTDQFDYSKAKANAQDAMARYPDLKAMVGLFAYNPPMILEALSEAGKLGEIEVIAFDEHDRTLRAIQEGHVHGTVVQNPYMYGYESIRVLAAMTRGEELDLPEDGFMNIPARLIRRDNVEEFWEDLRRKRGEVPDEDVAAR